MKRNRTMVGFVDLTLILLGSVALIAELQQRDAPAEPPIAPAWRHLHGERLHVSIERLFELDEARLSVEGDSWLRQLRSKADGRTIAVGVGIEKQYGAARLDAWEKAAARTAAIMYALEQGGYPPDRIEPIMPGEGEDLEGINIHMID